MPEKTLITTPFCSESTAAEVVAGVDLTGKRAIVTGGSSGIGIETARALAAAGAEVTLAVRNAEAGRNVAEDIIATTGNADVRVAELELAVPRSIAALVAGWTGPLDVLVNNAGVMALPGLSLTPQRWELHFATNHLGHFALAVGLHDALAKASAGARIVSLSSRGHLRSPVVFEDINFASRPYEPLVAYGQSKTANVLFAVEASRRWADDGVTANAVHPGAVATTNLSRHLDPDELERIKAAGVYHYKSAEQGAATSVLVATSPELDGIGGRYFQDCNEAPVVDPATAEETGAGVADYAVDPANAERLWQLSEATLDQQVSDVG
jgi:NAD(P)-dependent dehydrogenase (short-subunit alcohol dehydrogenase family)